MARTERLDRKALKQDAFVSFMARATAYVSANANLVFGIAAAVIVGIVLLVFWARGRTDTAFVADTQYSRVVRAYNAGAYPDVLAITQEISTSYRGTRASVLAGYLAGQAHLQLGNFGEAERAFREYIAQSSKASFYENAAPLGLAASLDGQGRFEEAAQLYLESAETLPEPLASDARMDAARSFRAAGSWAQAKSLLEQVKKLENARSRDASIELAVLESLEKATGELTTSEGSSTEAAEEQPAEQTVAPNP